MVVRRDSTHGTDGERNMEMMVRSGFTIPAWLAVSLVACGEPMPPVACSSFPPQTVKVGDEVTLEPCFEDPEMGALTLAAESSNREVATAGVLGDEVRIAGVSPGTAAVTVTATDPDMLTAEVAIEILVPNLPPRVAEELPPASVEPGDAVRLVLSEYFIDPDGQELVYDAVSLDTLVASTALSADTLVITGVSAGETTVRATATDAGGLSVTAPIEVEVRGNDSPVVAKPIPPAVVETGQTILRQLSDHFSDPDGDELVYDATSSDTLVGAVSLSADTLTVTGGSLGTAKVTVTATDPGGLSATTQWDFTVIEPSFRDDFDSEASLDNWEVPEGTTAEIDNGVLVLPSADGEQWTFVRRSWRTTDWMASARMANLTEDSWVQLVIWFSSAGRPRDAIALQVGENPDPTWETEDTNWRLLEKRGGAWKVDRSGESEAVGGLGEMVEVTLSHVGTTFSVAIGDSVVYSITGGVSGSSYFTSHVSLAVWTQSGATGTGVFDWVEVGRGQPSLREAAKHGSLPHHGAGARVEFGAIKWLRMGTRFRRMALEATHDRNRSTLSAKGSHDEMVAGRGRAIPARHEARRKPH